MYDAELIGEQAVAVAQRFPSSLRAVPPEVTLSRARDVARLYGISRVTDITRLDRVGVPVFSSVRPLAVEGSLCVNAGKGIRRIDAMVGAYMEAIEFAAAEPSGSRLEVILATPQDVLDGNVRPAAILDFCPIAQRRFDLKEPLACVEASEYNSGASVLVPAELVLMPYVHQPGTGGFGSTTNGLASGNTREEAVLHGLLELIERDVRSFQEIRSTSRIVAPASMPGHAIDIVDRTRAAGLEVSVRTLPNEFDIPCFEALVWDPAARSPVYLNGGYGCHIYSDIALIRALTEAIQSRLSWIHGGRDDLAIATEHAAAREDAADKADAYFRSHSSRGEVLHYDEVPQLESACGTESIKDVLDAVVHLLSRHGIRHVCTVPLTPGELPVQVMRVVVPRLEHFHRRDSQRVGPRLQALIRAS